MERSISNAQAMAAPAQDPAVDITLGRLPPDADGEQDRSMKGFWRHAVSRHYRLGRRLVASLLAALVFGLVMVFGTLWLSWTLEGAAAAINDAGSLRMQTVRIALVMEEGGDLRGQIPEMVAQVNQTFDNLRHGVPTRPLRLPGSDLVQAQFDSIYGIWRDHLSPLAMRYAQSTAGLEQSQSAYRQHLMDFVVQTNTMVHFVEQQNARDTALLRASQFGLIGLMIAGCVAMIYLMYGWIIRPVEALRYGVSQMAARNFSHRVPVESNDELGELAEGFNDMAAQLNEQYADLERRVQEKTENLALRNREISTLYEFSAYLSGPGDIRSKSEGFLSRLIAYFGADGGSVRILDPNHGNLHITVHQGLSDDLVQREQCIRIGDCLCGEAAESGVTVIHDFRQMPQEVALPCQEAGFTSIAVAQVTHGGKRLGIYTLHFQVPREFTENDRQLFESLGQHLGIAIENQRLLASTRELAIAQERNLVAQGLHDSIAQGLNFMKMQIRMLRDSIEREQRDEVQQGMDLLELGIKESYDDVRELLTNFRVRVQEGDLASALRTAAERFERQSGIQVQARVQDDGAPLPPEQQLQVLFVVQEAMSNIRKHAKASKVTIEMINHEDFEVCVQDDGQGFDPACSEIQAEQHIGLRIMRERAERMNATLNVTSSPGHGTRVCLSLEKVQRTTA